MKYTKESLYGLFADLGVASCFTPTPKKEEELIDYVLKIQEENQKLKKLDLIKYLEDKINKSKKQEIISRSQEIPKFYDIGISLGEQYAYKDILERVKSDKYE